MGKKDFILDNGKKAQSSMTLYWKSNKQRSKLPKQKRQPEQNEQQISDKRVMSNFQKWKIHKEKVITKAYTKPIVKQITDEPQSKRKQEEEQQNYLYEKMIQNKKSKVLIIPGFGSKHILASKIQIQKPTQANQSTNLLKLPDHLADLTQEDILSILRQKKNKKQTIKRQKQKAIKNQNNQNYKQSNYQDVLLGDQFINLMKQRQKDQLKRQKEKQELANKQLLQKSKPPIKSFFKSDILNKIEKQGIQKALQQKIEKQTKKQNKNQIKLNQKQSQILNTNIYDQKIEDKKTQFNIQSKFIPRVLKK